MQSMLVGLGSGGRMRTLASGVADLNQRIPRAGHSRILRDEAWMPLLDSVLDYAQQRYNVT